jgi:hypothetical protein
MTKEAKWRQKKRIKRKLENTESIKSENFELEKLKLSIELVPKETSTLSFEDTASTADKTLNKEPVLSTVQVITSDPSSSSLCQFFRQLGFPIVGDTFCRQEYWTLKRSIRNRLKDKLCIGCYKVEITSRGQAVDECESNVVVVERDVPEKLSAKFWERFVQAENSNSGSPVADPIAQ